MAVTQFALGIFGYSQEKKDPIKHDKKICSFHWFGMIKLYCLEYILQWKMIFCFSRRFQVYVDTLEFVGNQSPL